MDLGMKSIWNCNTFVKTNQPPYLWTRADRELVEVWIFYFISQAISVMWVIHSWSINVGKGLVYPYIPRNSTRFGVVFAYIFIWHASWVMVLWCNKISPLDFFPATLDFPLLKMLIYHENCPLLLEYKLSQVGSFMELRAGPSYICSSERGNNKLSFFSGRKMGRKRTDVGLSPWEHNILSSSFWGQRCSELDWLLDFWLPF